MDRLTRARRSALMAKVPSKDTAPERWVRSTVFRWGFRYRLHVQALPGCPDLVFPKLRKAIFVHGCFWHGHPRCRLGRLPRSNLRYWAPKIAGNKARDARNRAALRRAGWDTLILWACEDRTSAELKLRRFLHGRS